MIRIRHWKDVVTSFQVCVDSAHDGSEMEAAAVHTPELLTEGHEAVTAVVAAEAAREVQDMTTREGAHDWEKVMDFSMRTKNKAKDAKKAQEEREREERVRKAEVSMRPKRRAEEEVAKKRGANIDGQEEGRADTTCGV